jgi:PTS system beta-glucosides-specific IIC component
MDLEKTSKQIVDTLGGPDNIVNLTHCMTRLRFNLKDDTKANLEALKSIEGVMGVVNKGGVIQAIVGTDVDRFYKEIATKYVKTTQENSAQEGKKKNIFATALDLFSASFSPLIPAIMGAGFISIILALLKQFNILTEQSTTYTLLSNISNCVYYFFPVLIAYSLAGRLKVNQVFAIVVACFLIYPEFSKMFTTASDAGTTVTFFSVPVMAASYSKQIIPIFFSVFAQKYIEKFVFKYTPKVIRTMVGSGLVLILTVFITITVLGPAGAKLTELFNAGVYWIVDTCGWFAVPIMAFLNPFFLGTGLGTANFPIMLMSYVNNGYEALILPAALAGNAVQAGAGFAIAYKTKNKELRSVATECGVTALMGITEPIIFSVHYRLKKTFVTVMIASGIAAILPGVTRLACYALANGVLSIPAYLPGGIMNLVWACVTIVESIIIGFIATYLTKFEDPKDE